MTLLQWMERRLAGLLGRPAAPTLAAANSADQSAAGEPKWLQLARADLGIRELPGAAANPAIMRAWDYCDYKPPAGDETAWCSAKANEWLQCAGLPGTRQPNARSWLKWGAGQLADAEIRAGELQPLRLGGGLIWRSGSRQRWRSRSPEEPGQPVLHPL